MEEKFLRFANALSVKASWLDAVIWRQMKDMGQFALESVKVLEAAENPSPFRRDKLFLLSGT
jgi:hypothetical protein